MPQSIETKEYSYLNNIDKDTLDAMLMVANTLDENTLDALLDLIGGGASGGGLFKIEVTAFDDGRDYQFEMLDKTYSEIVEAIENGLVPYIAFEGTTPYTGITSMYIADSVYTVESYETFSSPTIDGTLNTKGYTDGEIDEIISGADEEDGEGGEGGGGK